MAVVSLLLLVGGGTGLAYWCFSGDTAKSKVAATGTEPDDGGGGPILPPELPPAKKAALSAKDLDTVAKLVRNGVAYLKKTQRQDGSWGDDAWRDRYVAFGGLTLLECGVPKNDPAVVRAAQLVRRLTQEMSDVYSMSLSLLFLDKLNEPQDKERIKLLAMRLVAGQAPTGGWSYTVPPVNRGEAEALHQLLAKHGPSFKQLQAARKADQKLVSSLPLAAQDAGVLRLTEAEAASPGFFRTGGDNSNTQFALLGLWAARRQGMPVNAPLGLVALRFRKSQNMDGSYNYDGDQLQSRHPTMTCAGLLGLAIEYGLSDDKQKKSPLADPMIERALKSLAGSIGEPIYDAAKPPPLIDTYFLWSIERVGVLYNLPKIEGQEWFPWGLSLFAQHQRPDGSWHAPEGHLNTPFVDTCFALLFLQRVNLVSDLTDKLTEMLAASTAPSLGGKGK